ncbi:MAG TPA: hypothetical protein VJ227_03255 [Patescibacteria group bacterium]|nr:hypothetical protein [Patescibacteria group bacterium]
MQRIWKWLVIALGTIGWSWTMVKSGWVYSFGMGFWGANGHDGIWHIALIESLSRGSLKMPIFSGASLQNYHIGYDLVIAFLHRITSIPVVNLYFQVAPPIIAALIGLLTYKFVLLWVKSQKAALWSTFFVYFGGSFSWILGKGESAFWSIQAISTLINPPFALSLVFLLLGLIYLTKLKIKYSTRDLILSIIFFGVLIEIKAYAGVLALGGLLVMALYELAKTKKWTIAYVFLGSLVLSAVLYYPLNKNATGLVIWSPFWFLESMIAGTDRLYLPKLAEAMLSYRTQQVIRKFVPTYLAVFLIFYIGNLGTRIIKEILVWKWIRKFKSVGVIEIFILSVIVAGILIPTFFVQKGTPWNTIQFFYYSLFFSGILAGISLDQILTSIKKTAFKYTLALLVIGLTIPTTILTLKDVYIPPRPPAMLSIGEMEALKFLSGEPSGIVLTFPFPFDEVASSKWVTAPKPLFLYTSTAYVSAFSKKDVFLEDYGNLDITNYGWPERLKEVEAWYKETDGDSAREFLKVNNIGYVYWLKDQGALLDAAQLGLSGIFKNSEVTIYKVELLND